jgi:SAM-dependent methyltransferase
VSDYHEYVAKTDVISEYAAYQARYADEPRESDKVLVRHAAQAVEGRAHPTVVDIGCSTGNLLHHLQPHLPAGTHLVGGEYSEEQLAMCRQDPRLEGIDFQKMDVTDLARDDEFDVAIVNAILYLFDDHDHDAAIASLGRAIRPGGTLLVFDFFHPYEQTLDIVERSTTHPAGMPLHFRPMARARELLAAAGFGEVTFEPFEIPIDLDGAPVGSNQSGFENLNTRTVHTTDGRRLLFRGALFQPWCHLIARKAI